MSYTGAMVRTLPYGSWPSTISAEQLAVGGNRLGSPQWVGEQLFWSEALAAEGGRQTIVRTHADPRSPDMADDDGAARPSPPLSSGTVTVLPAPFNARSRVHEYGGASWIALPAAVDSDAGDSQAADSDAADSATVRAPAASLPAGALPAGALPEGGAAQAPVVLFVNFTDQRVYAFVEGGTPQPISPVGPEVSSAGGPSLRWAQPTAVRLSDGTAEVWWVCEEHLDGADSHGAPLIERYIAALPLDGAAAEDQSMVRKVTPSSRFLAHPQLSPDGTQLAWISWEHPQMPWDGTELRLGRVAGGIVVEDSVLDGGTEVSVLQPQWRRDGELLYLSDRSGWWNPWTVQTSADPSAAPAPRQLLQDPQEYAGPLWQLGASWLSLIDADHALSIHGTATETLGVLDLNTGEVTPLELPHTSITGVSLRPDGALALHGASRTEFSAISVGRLSAPDAQWRLDQLGVVRSSREDAPDPGLLPTPEPITVPGPGGEEVHAVLYRPRQAGYAAPAGELPPFIAQVHGGPTGQAAVGLSLGIAYYTSRGIGVVDINYGGSTGFGRAYRDRLKGQWGVVDVADTVAVMEHLVNQGIADPERLGIEGGSAGGWTTLACLTRTETFAAGVSSFGVADLVALAEDTHDFESRYLDGLVGPYPEAAEIYRERAPLNHVDSLSCPVLLLQGEEDPIVPPNQAEMFRDALAAKSIPHAYLLFAGEQHGFRKAENIIASFEASLSFYGQIFGFEPAGIPHLELSR